MKREVENVIPFTPRREFTRAELRQATPTSGKRGIKELVDEVVDGKKRKVGYGGIQFDPEGVRGKGIMVGLKLGGCDVGNRDWWYGGCCHNPRDRGYISYVSVSSGIARFQL